jgi:mutator protein MutT
MNKKMYYVCMKPGVDYIGVGVGALIFNEKGELFLMKRGRKAKNEVGRWEAPGGTVDFGETLEQAIVREMQEEFGIDIEVIEQLPATDHLIPEENQHWVPTCFISKIKAGEIPKITEKEKCEDIGWFALDDLPQPLSVVTQLVLKTFLKKPNKKYSYEYFLATRVRNKELVEQLLSGLRKKGKKVYWCMENDKYHTNEDPEVTMEHIESQTQWKQNEMIQYIFNKDMEALKASEKLLMLLPLPEGKSAHIEAGVAYGLGKKCILIGKVQKIETLYPIFVEHFESIDDFINSL